MTTGNLGLITSSKIEKLLKLLKLPELFGNTTFTYHLSYVLFGNTLTNGKLFGQLGDRQLWTIPNCQLLYQRHFFS